MEKRSLVIMTRLDVKSAFDAALWPDILKRLKDLRCPRYTTSARDISATEQR
jgi:hypothetical protein